MTAKHIELVKKAIGALKRHGVPVDKIHALHQMGGSAFTDFFTKTIPSAAKSAWKGLKTAHDWVKSNKIASKVLNLIPDEKAKEYGAKAAALGYGAKKRTPKRMVGFGAMKGVRRPPLGLVVPPEQRYMSSAIKRPILAGSGKSKAKMMVAM